MSAPNRTTLLKQISAIGQDLQKLGVQTVQRTWDLAGACVQLQGTFPAGKDGAAAFIASASTASGKGEATIRNLVRAYEVREGLTAKRRQEVEGWSYDMVLSLAGKMTSPQQGSIISKVNKASTRSPIEVRKIKRDVVGTVKRDRQTSAEATTKLAEKVRESVQRLLDNNHPVSSLIAGIELRNEYPSGDLGAAVLFVAANAKAADKVSA